MTARTRRSADKGNASAGAVRQHGGTLPVYVCNTCEASVVWADSKRTGRKYLANVRRGYLDQRYYVGADVHRCEDVLARRAEDAEAAATAERNRELAAATLNAADRFHAGEITRAEFIAILDTLRPGESVAR